MLTPPDSVEFNQQIYAAQDLIAKGRHFKGISLRDSYKNFKDAYLVLHKLLDKVRPAELNSRIFTTLTAVFSGIVGWLLAKLF